LIFAHDYCGRLWLKIGLILLIPTVVSMHPSVNSNENVVGIVTLIVISVQVLVLVGSIFPVESTLKKNFNDNGNRR